MLQNSQGRLHLCPTSFLCFGCATQPVGSQFPDQGLTQAPCSGSAQSESLDHQEVPPCLFGVHCWALRFSSTVLALQTQRAGVTVQGCLSEIRFVSVEVRKT